LEPAATEPRPLATAAAGPGGDVGIDETRRMPLPAPAAALRTVGAILATIVIFWILITALGASPSKAFNAMFKGAFSGSFNFGQTLMIASLLCCTGIAAAIPFRAHLWNVGGEGQMWFGAFATLFVGFALPADTTPVLFATLCVLAGMVGGALWGFIPGLLKATINANEVITSLMMTFIAIELGNWATDGIWPEGATNQTKDLPAGAMLPNIWPNTLVTLGAVLAVVAAVVAWVILSRTRLGFEIRAIGLNPNAARMNGMSIGKVAIATFTLGGAFAGLAGTIFLTGINGALPAGFNLNNYGYLGVAVALVARLNPLLLIPSAVLFSALRVGADGLQADTGLSTTVGQILMATFVVLLLAFRLIRLVYPEATK
jgi:simple sugar transport system permease protein